MHKQRPLVYLTLATAVIVLVCLVLITTSTSNAALQSTSTLESYLETAFPNEDDRATAQAIFENEIAAAVEATLFALTPTATPPPTTIPIADTFADHNPVLGPEDAPITIVEFSDYLCPYCGRFHAETLEPLLEHYGDLVRYAYREYPVIGGQTSAAIGAAAQCANLQDRYWEFAALIWDNQTGANQQQMSQELLDDFATQVDLNIDDYQTCLTDGTGYDLVVLDYQAGRDWAITGTPTFIINGEKFVGAQPLDNFLNYIDRELVALGIEPPER